MPEELQELVNATNRKLGLNKYYIGRSHLHREKNHRRETIYYLSMEWFPLQNQPWDKEDENPEGTLSIEIDLHTNRLRSLLFVGGINDVNNQDYFPTNDLESIIEWVEHQTGLTWGKDFELVHEKKGSYLFRGLVDHIPVYPSATITVSFNNKDEIQSYTMIGEVPEEEAVVREAFSLTPEIMEAFFKEQCKRVKFPHIEDKKWHSIYAIEEIFISNDQTKKIPYDSLQQYGESIDVNQVMEWEYPLQGEFTGEPLFHFEEIRLEQAQRKEKHPDFLPITTSMAEAAIQETRDLLRREFPDGSGEWMLKTIRREAGYLFSYLVPSHREQRVFGDNIKVVIHPDTLQVVNYIDPRMLFADIQSDENAKEAMISKKEAFETLRETITVTPTYVYDHTISKYRLCGKVDSDYGLHATTGEVMLIDDF